jgi:isocitrate lyase
MSIDKEISEMRGWFESPRFAGIKRLHTAREVVEQRGSIRNEYTVARDAAEGFHARLRALYKAKKCVTTFGPYSPGQAVAMKRMGIEAIYLGGWATSAKGSAQEDPGPDLASYPLSQVPNEAAPIVRALLTADKNQYFARSRMSEEQRKASDPVDFSPFIIADADTGHGGDAHVRNLIRRFVEVGVPGYHIEDQKPGVKKCGHQGGKVLVSEDEQIKRLSAARFQLDIMQVPGIIVARTDAESATLLDGRSDERDQPFILGASNTELPSFKVAFLAMLRRFHRAGIEELSGHQLYATSEAEYVVADAWLDEVGLGKLLVEAVAAYEKSGRTAVDAALDKVFERLVDVWQAEANVKTYGEAVADVMRFLASEGVIFPMTEEEWLAFAARASFYTITEKAREMNVSVVWDCEHAKTPDGYYQVRGGIEYAIAKSLAVAPYADILWMETKTADLHDAKIFADAIHAKFPDAMLAYNLSPSFNWDTTGLSDDEMRKFPEELGKMGFVFNFITYGGHQIDGLAGEEFAHALREDGMLALARLQRKFRLLESPYRTPQTLVGGPRADAGLSALAGRTATTKAMGKGSTQFQHVVLTEVPPKLLEEWLDLWRAHHGISGKLKVVLRPHTPGSELLELSIMSADNEKAANVIFDKIIDRRGHVILSVRDQNTFDTRLRRKRMMTLAQLFLIHRYKIDSVHYLTRAGSSRRSTTRSASSSSRTSTRSGSSTCSTRTTSRCARSSRTSNPSRGTRGRPAPREALSPVRVRGPFLLGGVVALGAPALEARQFFGSQTREVIGSKMTVCASVRNEAPIWAAGTVHVSMPPQRSASARRSFTKRNVPVSARPTPPPPVTKFTDVPGASSYALPRWLRPGTHVVRKRSLSARRVSLSGLVSINRSRSAWLMLTEWRMMRSSKPVSSWASALTPATVMGTVGMFGTEKPATDASGSVTTSESGRSVAGLFV